MPRKTLLCGSCNRIEALEGRLLLTSAPYPGPNPAPVPGLIQAENFDNGGEGVAFHDLTAANQGGKYRTTGVDVEACGEGGYDLSFDQPGEWLKYSVNVPTAGTYKLDIREAYNGTNVSGGTVHLEVDGSNVTGALTLTKTGGWQVWQTVTKTGISLSAGAHVLKLSLDADGAGSTANTAYLSNVNWVQLSLPAAESPYPGPGAAAVPGTIQGENFDNGGEGVALHDLSTANQGGKYRTTGVDVETCSEGGYDLSFNQPSEWLKYMVNVSGGGNYSLDIREAYNGVNTTGGIVHLEVDGADVTGAITLAKTGGWQTWQTVTKTGISLTAGPHTLRLVMDKDGAGSTASSAYLANINWLKLSTSSGAGTPDPSFGSGGIATSSLTAGASAMVVQSNGKVIVGANVGTAFTLTRFAADGTLDTTYGSGGKVTTDVSDVAGIALTADGNIVVAGTTAGRSIQLAEYTPTGAPNTLFGTGGETIFHDNTYPGGTTAGGDVVPPGKDWGDAVAIDGSGRIVVADEEYPTDDASGSEPFVVRFSAAGVHLDTLTYDAIEEYFSSASATMADGSVVFIVTAGSGDPTRIYRVDSSGLGGGVVPGGRRADVVAGGGDGRLYLLSGGSLACLDGNLTPVPSFAGGGWLDTGLAGSVYPLQNLLAVQRDGKVLVGDSASLCRFNPDGTKDLSFGNAGTVSLAITANTIALGADGRINIAGTNASGQAAVERLVNDPAPFGLQPATVPGTVEAENFDQGGEGIAWHDTDSLNGGGQYRSTGVDIETCSEGSYDLGFVHPGEWLKYTVNVSKAGPYNLDIREAYNGANASGGTVHLEVDGIDVTGAMILPTTGGWQTWQTFTKMGIRLSAGQHVLRLVMDKDGAGSTDSSAYLANINWLKLSTSSGAGTPDPGFGSGGIATTSLTNSASEIAVQSDGKVILQSGNSLVRLTADGNVDTAFGSGGLITPGFDSLADFALTSGGYIVAAGTTGGSIALAEYTPAGTLYSGFGTAGRATYYDNSALGDVDSVGGVGIDGQGRIVVGDNVRLSASPQPTQPHFVRFSSAGAFLSTLAQAGGFLPTVGDGVSASDGSVVFSGADLDLAMVYRMDTSGSVSSWSGPGVSAPPPLAAGGDGRIYLFGTPGGDTENVFRIDVSNPSGDMVYDTGLPGGPGGLIAVQRDGKFLAGNGTRLSRFNPDGTNDLSFGSAGSVSIPFGSVIAIGYDGRINIAGTDASGHVAVQRLINDPAPFGMQPAALPGTIQAENFDQGGEGIAWHDVDATNQGGKYRTTGVDIETTTDIGGGYDVGFNQPGEWLKYTMNVATAGTYSLDIRDAYGGANANGGTVHLECDGVDVSGPITLAKTGGWQTWQTVSKAGISLSAGTHVLKLVMEKDGVGSTANTAYLANINWIKLT